MTLFDDAGATHEPARVRAAGAARDATGAGDAVLAFLAWRLAQGDGAVQAVRWASAAAGLAVQAPGSGVLPRDALLDAWEARD